MLELSGVEVRFRASRALADVSLTVRPGERVAIVGPSGSGKTTLLRVVAGLQPPTAGEVRWDGRDLASVPVERRGFGLLFQDHALFPDRDVAGNVAFGLRMRRWDPPRIEDRVREVLRLVDLGGFERRAVDTLSGGEQQRVALARALAPQPRLLMLDEPLASLDRTLRTRLADDLRRIVRAVGTTVLHVTHDLDEAFTLGDRLVVMRAGRIEAEGPPEMVWEAPTTAFVARFLGQQVVPLGEGIPMATAVGGAAVTTPWGPLAFPATGQRLAEGSWAVAIRPDALVPDGDGTIRGRVVDRVFRGDHVRVRLARADGGSARTPGEGPETLEVDARFPVPSVGEELRLRLDPARVSLVRDDASSG